MPAWIECYRSVDDPTIARIPQDGWPQALWTWGYAKWVAQVLGTWSDAEWVAQVLWTWGDGNRVAQVLWTWEYAWTRRRVEAISYQPRTDSKGRRPTPRSYQLRMSSLCGFSGSLVPSTPLLHRS